MKHVLHVSCDIQLRICINTQTSYMSGMNTIQHNVLDLNHYLVWVHAPTNTAPPKSCTKLAKMQPLCHQYTLLRVSETHITHIIHDRQNISQPGLLRQTLGTSRATLAHRQVVKNQRQHSPSPSGQEKHRPSSSRHNENKLAGNFAHMSFHPCQTQNFICTRASQPHHDVGRCTRARQPSDVFATVVRIKWAHYPHAPSNIGE